MAINMDSLPADFDVFSLKGVAFSTAAFLSLSLVYFLGTAIYNAYFHPLKHIPGPFLARASHIPMVYYMRTGSILPWLQAMHEKYGEAVRVAPNEISFISGETAWQDIYGFRIGKYKNTGAYLKDKTWYRDPPNEVHSIITANEEEHTRMRRNLSHAFSDKALRSQESMIQSYVDLLINRVGEHGRQGKSIDLMRWYNYATFDIISDLAFGVPLYCLRDSNNHTWIDLVYGSVTSNGTLATRMKIPILALYDSISTFFGSSGANLAARNDFFNLASSQVGDRINIGVVEGRTDFYNFILKNQEKESQALTRGEMDSNSVTFLIAGSETTATTLSGITYLLCRYPKVCQKLTHEIRSRFSSNEDITMEAVNNLEYMIACLTESLRLYPPVPTGLPRVVPGKGDVISGYYVSGGTSVYMSQHAANHSSRNFRDPDNFVPERWLGDEKYMDDKREVWNPFNFGPRNCLGKNLALAEMRLILAKMLFNFDLELVNKEKDWMNQKVYTLWEKPGLDIKITPVRA
ncbi:hypothetical protein NX059_005058 [Plenodomus lindquistii]|nr:hypothetical protein NX059_005058 [Plenodomus lindquistii]